MRSLFDARETLPLGLARSLLSTMRRVVIARSSTGSLATKLVCRMTAHKGARAPAFCHHTSASPLPLCRYASLCGFSNRYTSTPSASASLEILSSDTFVTVRSTWLT